MANAKTIPCPVRCEVNYLNEVFGITIKSPRTGNAIYFDNLAIKAIPRGIHDRIVIGYRHGGTTSFAIEELRQLVDLARRYEAAPYIRKFNGSWSR